MAPPFWLYKIKACCCLQKRHKNITPGGVFLVLYTSKTKSMGIFSSTLPAFNFNKDGAFVLKIKKKALLVKALFHPLLL